MKIHNEARCLYSQSIAAPEGFAFDNAQRSLYCRESLEYGTYRQEDSNVWIE